MTLIWGLLGLLLKVARIPLDILNVAVIVVWPLPMLLEQLLNYLDEKLYYYEVRSFLLMKQERQ